MKNALKLATTLNIVIAIISYVLTNSIIYPILLIILSIIYLTYNEKTITNLYTKKSIITILSLINLILNPISGIIMLIGQDKINEEYQKEEKKEEPNKEKDKEKNKISLLLNLGVGLVGLSGIILATTNWQTINDTFKLIMLLIMAVIFLTLSLVIEKKLNLKTLAKNYWLLGMLFIILTIIGNGYLQTTSNWFSYYGDGKYIYTALTSIIISLLSLITNKKYENQIYKNICYIGILSSISFILLQLKIKIELILIAINIILIILNIIKHNKLEKIKDLSKYLTYGVSILSLLVIIDSKMLVISSILSLLTIINLALVALKGTTVEGIISAILINLATTFTLTNLSTIIEGNIVTLIAITIYSIYYLLNIIKIENKTFKTFMNIISNIVMLILILISTNEKILLTIVTLFITATSIINYYKNTNKSEKILLPIKIVVSIISIISLVQEVFTLNISYTLIILYLIVFIIYTLIKNKNIKRVSLIIYYIIFILSLLINQNKELLPSIINLTTSVTTLLIITKEQNKIKTNIAYIVFLLTINAVITYTNILNTTVLNNSIIVLLLYGLIIIFTVKNKTLNKINSLAIILPLITMTTDINITYETHQIIENLISMYIILLIDLFLLKKDKDRDILTTIISAFILLRIIFIQSWLIGLYTGTIALIFIIIGFIKKEYKGLYIEGIIITLINLIYQFQYILKELPLWLYIFASGLIIIGLVTYKEIKNTKK